tara:strand:+ start:33 stop:395 length:363 start_codon:yes stop_codon:yes gene_type:complete
MKIKHSQEDKLFSLYIRNKAKGICEHCKKYKGVKKLQASHFIGRRNKAVRWDEENVSALCFTCHMVIMTENPHYHTKWMKEKLGNRYNDLIVRSREIKKWKKEDLKDLRYVLNKELKRIS